MNALCRWTCKRFQTHATAVLSAAGVRERQARILDFEHFLLADVLSEDEQEALINLEGLRPVIAELRSMFAQFEVAIEQRMVQLALELGRALISPVDTIHHNYLLRYAALASREIALLQISENDRVLFIGSGPFPVSAIEYAQQTACQVDCVEKLAEAVEQSRKVVSRLKLDDRLRVIQAAGEGVDVSRYTKIVVGVLAVPKLGIFRNIMSRAAREAWILCRTTFGLRQAIYPNCQISAPNSPASLHVAETDCATGDQVISGLLVRLNEQAQEVRI